MIPYTYRFMPSCMLGSVLLKTNLFNVHVVHTLATWQMSESSYYFLCHLLSLSRNIDWSERNTEILYTRIHSTTSKRKTERKKATRMSFSENWILVTGFPKGRRFPVSSTYNIHYLKCFIWNIKNLEQLKLHCVFFSLFQKQKCSEREKKLLKRYWCNLTITIFFFHFALFRWNFSNFFVSHAATVSARRLAAHIVHNHENVDKLNFDANNTNTTQGCW